MYSQKANFTVLASPYSLSPWKPQVAHYFSYLHSFLSKFVSNVVNKNIQKIAFFYTDNAQVFLDVLELILTSAAGHNAQRAAI